MELGYIQPLPDETIAFSTAQGHPIHLPKATLLNAVIQAHQIVDKISDFEVNIFEILGMRNLSAFIGELFAAALSKTTNGFLLKNPHQDGYPDLLVMDEHGQAIWKNLEGRLREKQPFSPFANGGLEIKATCGSLPTPAYFTKKGLVKPEIGDQRIEYMRGYDWKAHHRDTNNLVGLLWDFMNGLPRITAVFFSSNLSAADWGAIVQPKDGGGRTTSVSIMPRSGVKKMYEGIVWVIGDNRYINFLNKYNQGSIIPPVPLAP